MQIRFDNWDISVRQPNPIAQGDNLSEPLTVEGRLPEGYSSWSLLLCVGSEENVITLGTVDGKPGVLLTGDMLPFGKVFYKVHFNPP